MMLLDTKPWAEVHSPFGAQTCPELYLCAIPPLHSSLYSILRDKGQHARVYFLPRCVKSD
jgi:hypothetical protein